MAKQAYKNLFTGEIKQFEVELDTTGHAPMYRLDKNVTWKAETEWTLNVVNSTEFFASAHENRVRFTQPPLDGSDAPYGMT